MNASSTQALIVDNVAVFGTAFLAIIGATIAIGVGYLVFRIGWRKLKGSLN